MEEQYQIFELVEYNSNEETTYKLNAFRAKHSWYCNDTFSTEEGCITQIRENGTPGTNYVIHKVYKLECR